MEGTARETDAGRGGGFTAQPDRGFGRIMKRCRQGARGVLMGATFSSPKRAVRLLPLHQKLTSDIDNSSSASKTLSQYLYQSRERRHALTEVVEVNFGEEFQNLWNAWSAGISGSSSSLTLFLAGNSNAEAPSNPSGKISQGLLFKSVISAMLTLVWQQCFGNTDNVLTAAQTQTEDVTPRLAHIACPSLST